MTSKIEGRRASRKAPESGARELKKSAATRLKILDAAADIFAERGFGQTLMGDIADRVGIHVTAIYYHFANKVVLAEEVINHVARVGGSEVREAIEQLDANAGFDTKLTVGLKVQLEGVTRRRNYVRAQLKLLSELPADAQKRHRQLLKGSVKFWRDLFETAASRGELKPGFDPRIARMVLIGSINWTVEWYRGDIAGVAEIAAQMAHHLLYGCATPSN